MCRRPAGLFDVANSGDSSMRKPLYLALVALLGTTGIAAAGPDTVRVRLDHSDLVATEAVGVTPISSTDYSGFRVLELSRADADKLLSRSTRAVEIVDAGRIRFNDVSFDPLREGQQSNKGYFPTTADGKGLHLVQFNAPAKQESAHRARKRRPARAAVLPARHASSSGARSTPSPKPPRSRTCAGRARSSPTTNSTPTSPAAPAASPTSTCTSTTTATSKASSNN